MPDPYQKAKIACRTGFFLQAAICNLNAVLFIPMATLYGFTYIHLGTLVAVNFIAQVSADVIFSGLIERIGYRRIGVLTGSLAFLGMLLTAAAPLLFADVFFGVALATGVAAFASGLLEVVVSPLSDAIHEKDKYGSMSMTHSFYAWGQIAVIVMTTLLVRVFGAESWPYIVLGWSALGAVEIVLFAAARLPADKKPQKTKKVFRDLFSPVFLFGFLAIFFGAAAEVTMNQWASTFAEKGLGLPKVAGDLVGMCGYALFLGIGRTLHARFSDKLDLGKLLIGGSLLAAACYVIAALSPFPALSIAACAVCGLATSLLWPGTLVQTAKALPSAGAWMFALLAVGGDVGAAVSNEIAGLISDTDAASFAALAGIGTQEAGMRLALLCIAAMPLLAALSHAVMQKIMRTSFRESPEG